MYLYICTHIYNHRYVYTIYIYTIHIHVQTYVGTFRDGKKEGRGVAYSVSNPEDGTAGGTITYKGEYSQDKRHGFGVAYFAEGHRYLGMYSMNSVYSMYVVLDIECSI